MPIGAVIEPVDGDCFHSNTRELLAGVQGGHPGWTRLELAEAAGANFQIAHLVGIGKHAATFRDLFCPGPRRKGGDHSSK
jgi:hypothetical protein